MPSRRILVTGLSTYWGGRLAQALESHPDVETIVGVDSEDPNRELERTEFVRVGTQHSLLKRIVDAARIDTVVDTRLVVDSATTSPRLAHENNVIGTMNILAACSGRDSTVRKLVFKSSAHYYGCEQDDPAFFTERMTRPHAPRTPIERDILEAEAAVRDYAERRSEATVTVLRCANVLGPDATTSHSRLFSLPAVPMILGFDPRCQFVHADDVVASLEHAIRARVPGVYNVAGDGVLSLTEIVGLLGKAYAPVISPWGTGLALSGLRRLGLRVPVEMVNQLRFGRGIDNRRYKAAGFSYRYTTRETVIRFAEHLRLHPVLRGVREPYRYEREVEEFLRWSPSVQDPDDPGAVDDHANRELRDLRDELQRRSGRRVELPRAIAPAPEPTAAALEERTPQVEDIAIEDTGHDGAGTTPAPAPLSEYDELEAEEIVALLGSLERGDLVALRAHEAAGRARQGVVRAIDSLLARAHVT